MALDPADNAPGRDPNPLFADHSIDANFGRTVARGGMITAVAQVVSLGLNLLSFFLLSRLLSPEDIGLVAITTVVTGIALAFAESGLSTATVQSPTLSRYQASNLFWFNVVMSVASMVVCLAMSPGVSWFYGDPRYVALVAVTSLSIPIFGLGIQHLALLRRTMQLDRIAYATIVSAVISNGLAVMAAWWLENYWALVIKIVAQGVVMSGMAWAMCHWMPSWPRRGVGSRQLATFGMKVFASSILFMLSQAADTAVLGRIASAGVVGVFDRAYQLLIAPIRQINAPLAGVVLPALSRCREDKKLYRALFMSVATLVISAVAPMAGLVVGAPDWCVSLAMGDGWEAAIPVFQIIGLGLVLTPLFNSTSWLFMSQARAGEMMKWQGIDAAFRIFLIVCGAFYGLTGIVTATVVRVYTMPHGFYWALGKNGPVGLNDYVRLEVTALAAALGALLAVLGFRGLIAEDVSPWVGAPVAGLASLAASTMVLCLFPESRRRLAQAIRLLRRRNDPVAAVSAAV